MEPLKLIDVEASNEAIEARPIDVEARNEGNSAA
jgi:hypothetical protein